MSEALDYILGTHAEELQRLGFQHRVWADDGHRLWRKAGFQSGQKMLDLGCGPGFATFDMAEVAGPKGEVTGYDRSEVFIHYAARKAREQGLDQLKFVQGHFADMELPSNHYDAVYSRWVFSWIEDVEGTVEKVANSLRSGGRFALQEYLDWGTFKIFPEHPHVTKMIDACRESWRKMPGEIDVCATLLQSLTKYGFKIVHIAPLERTARPGSLTWQWPTSFLKIYGHQLVSLGLISPAEIEQYLATLPSIESDPSAFLVTPLMMEIIVEKE